MEVESNKWCSCSNTVLAVTARLPTNTAEVPKARLAPVASNKLLKPGGSQKVAVADVAITVHLTAPHKHIILLPQADTKTKEKAVTGMIAANQNTSTWLHHHLG